VVAALVTAAPALAGTTTINVTAAGFAPQEVEIRPGDTVTWRNTDTANHQIISNTGEFRSDVLKPGESYSFVFETPSSYAYHDGTNSDELGFIHVLGSKVTLAITQIRAVYGSQIRVFGSIPADTAGSVTIHITPYRGRTTTRRITTDADGTYELTYRPRIRTEFSATWNGTAGEQARTVLVRPLVIFKPLNGRRNLFFVRVTAKRSYAHKLVRIQRLSSRGAWVTNTIVKLNRFGWARFTGKFARGKTRARAWVTKSPGYTVGYSRTQLIQR
jgi:hypothetical protein